MKVSIADLAVYHALWFITARTDRLAFELDDCVHIREWMARVAAFGNGTILEITSKEALDTADASTPADLMPSDPIAEDPPIGTRVRVRADDYGRDPLEGELVQIDRERLTLLREDPSVGAIAVHFPRLGYGIREV